MQLLLHYNATSATLQCNFCYTTMQLLLHCNAIQYNFCYTAMQLLLHCNVTSATLQCNATRAHTTMPDPLRQGYNTIVTDVCSSKQMKTKQYIQQFFFDIQKLYSNAKGILWCCCSGNIWINQVNLVVTLNQVNQANWILSCAQSTADNHLK